MIVLLVIGAMCGGAASWAQELSENPYGVESTSNPYGQYGSPFGVESANNPFGRGVPLETGQRDSGLAPEHPLLAHPDFASGTKGISLARKEL